VWYAGKFSLFSPLNYDRIRRGCDVKNIRTLLVGLILNADKAIDADSSAGHNIEWNLSD
jgi:hypothetical protein